MNLGSKTPEQRAKRLYDKWVNADGFVPMVEQIVEQIKEAEIETVLRLCEGEDCFVAQKEQEAYQRGYEQAKMDIKTVDEAGSKKLDIVATAYKCGFREAIEKAAELLEDESTRLIKDSVNHADIIRSYIDCLAQLIRAMSEAKPEE